MFRFWGLLFSLILLAFVLAGCNQSINERAEAGINEAEVVFDANDKKTNDEVEGLAYYQPPGFSVDDASDSQNIVFTYKNETYLLFNNPNEKSDSRLFYDLLKADNPKNLIEEKTFSTDDVFGFSAIIEKGENSYELIASVGGVKMTTLTKERHIEDRLARMMEIVRSVEQ